MSQVINTITDLNSIVDLEKTAKALALADAIMMPDWEYRYFSFNSNWDGNKQEMIASMRDGAGGEYFINFTNEGIVGKVFYGEALPETGKALTEIPDSFQGFKVEPAFNLESTTFFFWREKENVNWRAFPGDLKEYPLLGFLLGGVENYHSWAENYYEREIDLETLKQVFLSLSVTAEQLSILNPEIELEDLNDDLEEIL